MEHEPETNGMGWGRFAAMVATSTAIMFCLMYQLIYTLDHARFSLNRTLASLLMGCVMTVVMLSFMWPMYKGKATKVGVLVVAALLGSLLLIVNRHQLLVGDSSYLNSMIPHHSIAINSSRKATISDPRVRQLADRIIESQVIEINQMELLLEDLQRNGERGEHPLPPRSTEITPAMEREISEALE